MVNHLLTITIKVNDDPISRIGFELGVIEMKKANSGRGFWSWLMGSGWSNTGANG